jgi:ribonuclease VapC
MVIDTSAIVALLFDQPDADAYEAAIANAEAACMSAVTALECSIVLERRYGPIGGEKLEALLVDQEVEIVAFERDQLEPARAAFRRFGRGRHPAGLNFGDCFSYALAKARAVPLLFKGNDFAQTDVQSVL